MDTVSFSTSDSWAGIRLEIRVNGRSSIDMVREVEAPFAAAEGHPDLAGNYMGLPAEEVLPPSRHLLGEPEIQLSGFQNKTDLLLCTRNEEGCWPFQVDVWVSETEVVWSNFSQPHRGPDSVGGYWKYDRFEPFRFERTQYEEALRVARLLNP